METIHDKLKENSCIHNQPGAFEVQWSRLQNLTLLSRRDEQTKVPKQCGSRGGNGIWWHGHIWGPRAGAASPSPAKSTLQK